MKQFHASWGNAPICFLGPSGFGKTSLLTQAIARLRDQLWICGFAEASSDTATAIEDLLTDIHRSLPRRNIVERAFSRILGINITAGVIGFGLTLRDAQGSTSYGRLAMILSRLVKLSTKNGAGLAIFIDELQVLSESDINKILSAASQLAGLPIAMVFSGLPSLTDLGGADKEMGRSTAHMDYHSLEPLTRAEATAALTNPLASIGGSFNPEALERIIDFANGHPLVVQMLGSNA
jgi:hypothetical protein